MRVLAALALSLLSCASLAAAEPGTPVAPVAPPAPVYRLSSTLNLPGVAPSWDYLSLDLAHGRLFLGRRAAGVSVIDLKTNRQIATIANSEKANVALIIPALDRGYTANEDGSTTEFQLSTLKTLKRIQLGEAADAAFWDPASRQVIFTFGDSKELIFFDPATDKVTAHLAMSAEELEGVAIVGDGTLFVNERDIGKLARVDTRNHKLLAEYDLPGCTLPTGIAYDPANHRVFVGCKGEKPVLAVVNGDSGQMVTTLEIGRGNDGVVFDPATRRIITANGIDANMVIVQQIDADHYVFASAFTTRPIARTLAYDPATRRIYTMVAEGMVDPARKRNLRAGSFYPNRYLDNTTTVLTYSPN